VRAFEQFQAGESSEAEKVAIDAMAMTTESSEQSLTDYGLILLHTIWMKEDSYAKAIEFYTGYIQSRPDARPPYTFRAEHYWYNAQPEQSLKDFNRALEFDSEDSGNLMGRGQVYVELGKPGDAAADLQKALKLLNRETHSDPQHLLDSIAYTRNGLGAACALQGNYPKALMYFEHSILVQPENGWVYFNRAKALEMMGEASKALADYEKSLACRNPKLTPHKRAYAESRIGQLGL
jgi:tetratricopeptide (TPR) repeat protein